MRYFLALAFVTACGRGDHTAAARVTTARVKDRGSDALVLRMPRRGGVARVTAFASVDSTIWTSSDRAPAIDRVLAFDDDAGILAFVDSRGAAGRIDLRLGTVASATVRGPLRGLASADASAIYGVGSDGAVVRLTLDGNWVYKPPQPAREVFPLRDGTLVVLGGRGESSTLWRIRAPGDNILDSLPLSAPSLSQGTQMGGRLYFVSERNKLMGVTTPALQPGPTIELDHPVVALVATPSGDRLYVATDSTREIAIVDRYHDRIAGHIELPEPARELRMDPLGRYLLARAARGDSVWIIAVATDLVIGSTRTAWRADLPFIAADGAVVTARGADVFIVDPETRRDRRRIGGGASDFWFAFEWTGFRPRAAGLDSPVDFAPRDSADSAVAPPPPRPADTVTAAQPTVKADSAGFLLSFAALLSETKARELADRIRVRGQAPRVVAAGRDGTMIYRVVLGPYPTREDAERAGRESGQDFWVYRSTP